MNKPFYGSMATWPNVFEWMDFFLSNNNWRKQKWNVFKNELGFILVSASKNNYGKMKPFMKKLVIRVEKVFLGGGGKKILKLFINNKKNGQSIIKFFFVFFYLINHCRY